MVSEETASHREERATSALSPVAYNESVMPALRLVRSSRRARLVGRALLLLLVVSTVVIAFAPWQQSVRGEGRVVAYSPQARPQIIEAPIKGRIVRWGEGVYENALVQKGQVIVEVQDLDAGLLMRLEDQLMATEQSVAAQRQVLTAAENNLLAAETTVESYEAQVRAYTQVKTQIIAAAQAYVDMAEEKLKAEQKNLEELEAALSQEKADYDRQKQLYEEKIVSQLKYQMAERKYKEAVAKVEKAEAYIEAARDELEGKTQEREAKTQKAQVDIDYAEAQLRKGRGEIAKAESEVAKAKSELNKAIKISSEMQTKLSRQQSQVVTAPLDGYLLNVISNQGGAMIKAGDPICTIVPDTEDRAVELMLSGNDVPLVHPGEEVRLQFEGWPAVQFSGWPSVAVGTFGGEVISVDQTDDQKGRFRCLILPEETHQQWPEERFLRQGVRANGWVLLNRVPLWWEIWRKLNGFPLVIDSQSPDAKGKKFSKSAKLAKPK
ncbi:MAG: HlyD family efflux transporter periplasmic adaptor subunit [Planctomycetaceae bacterium]|nr:HlyD family efflux transporter periplasmic adaptor subunit [Planctomycetaceae bacterium]